MENKLSHTNEQGKANMVDISSKGIQLRTAAAQGEISLQAETIEIIKENNLKKGDVISTARLAGIQGAKKTSELIPLCHNILLENINLSIQLANKKAIAQSEVKCTGKTGAEMEALTAVSTALLTIYDMCKAVDKSMVISDIHLINKTKSNL